jgi:hypothetical protein
MVYRLLGSGLPRIRNLQVLVRWGQFALCGLRFAACAAAGCASCWLLAAGRPVACGEPVACCVWLVACGLLVGGLCCGSVVVAGPGLDLALALCMALYSILYRIQDTGCKSLIFAWCCRWGGLVGCWLLAAGFNLCHLPSAICHLQSAIFLAWVGCCSCGCTLACGG